MKFKIYTLIAIINFSFILKNCISQTFNMQNQVTFGGNNQDSPHSFIKTTDGGFICAGWSKSGISGDKTSSNSGGIDYWIVKFDSTLNLSWQVNIGGDKDDLLNDLISVSNGYLCLGSSKSSISGNKTENNCSNDIHDFWLIKLNNEGNILWQKVYGGSDSETGSAIIELSDKSILIAGNSSSNISCTKSVASRGYSDYWLIKVDSIGNVLWDRTYGGIGFEFLRNIVVNTNGNIFLSGTSSSSISGEKTEDNFGVEDIWIVKLDVYGNLIWDKTIGGSDDDAIGFVALKDNYLYVLSTSFSNPSGTKTANNKGVCDYWLTKLDTDGIIIWDKTYGGSNYDIAESITFTSNNQILLSGGSWSGISDDKTEVNKGIYDYWLLNIDTAGNINWQKTIGGSDYDQLIKTVEVSPNNYMLAGYSKSNMSGDKTDNSRGLEDFWVVSLDVITGITKVINQSNSFIYPNPCSNIINIKTNEGYKNSIITISDITGRQITTKLIENTNTKLDISMFERGIYFYSILSNQQVIESGKFVKE